MKTKRIVLGAIGAMAVFAAVVFILDISTSGPLNGSTSREFRTGDASAAEHFVQEGTGVLNLAGQSGPGTDCAEGFEAPDQRLSKAEHLEYVKIVLSDPGELDPVRILSVTNPRLAVARLMREQKRVELLLRMKSEGRNPSDYGSLQRILEHDAREEIGLYEGLLSARRASLSPQQIRRLELEIAINKQRLEASTYGPPRVDQTVQAPHS